MKHEDFKIGDRYSLGIFEVKVISKSDEYKIITTIDNDGNTGTWLNDDLEDFSPIEGGLPEEGLLVSGYGSLAYKLSDGSGYGFAFGSQSRYSLDLDKEAWGFDDYWKPATPEQKKKFVEMLWREWVKMGNDENTKIEAHARVSLPKGLLNKGVYNWRSTCRTLWNKNGMIFCEGKFATPRKETATKPQVGKQYTHKKGNTYTVIGLTNNLGDREDKDFPVTVVYMDQEGRHWSRPLSRWHKSFKLKE